MTEPSEHARQAAEQLDCKLTHWFSVSICNPDTGKPDEQFVQLFQSAIDAATEADKERLEKLFAIVNHESSESKWRVTLDYDNYQDGARVLDGDGKVVAECYDLEKSPIEQFRAAIDRALHPEQKEKE